MTLRIHSTQGIRVFDTLFSLLLCTLGTSTLQDVPIRGKLKDVWCYVSVQQRVGGGDMPSPMWSTKMRVICGQQISNAPIWRKRRALYLQCFKAREQIFLIPIFLWWTQLQYTNESTKNHTTCLRQRNTWELQHFKQHDSMVPQVAHAQSVYVNGKGSPTRWVLHSSKWPLLCYYMGRYSGATSRESFIAKPVSWEPSVFGEKSADMLVCSFCCINRLP